MPDIIAAEVLGFFDSLAVIILQKLPFYEKSGRLATWATQRLHPVFERLVDKAVHETLAKDMLGDELKGRPLHITYWSEIKDNRILVEGVFEAGISFRGVTSGMFSRFKTTRELCIVPQQEGAVSWL